MPIFPPLRATGALLLSGALILSGCASTTKTGAPVDRPNKAIGAGVGAATGAAIGAIAGGEHRGRNAAIGAGAGALTGLAIGAYMDAQEKKLRERLSNTGVAVVREGDDILLRVPNDLTFDVDRTSLKPDVRDSLVNIAKTVVEYPKTNVRVIGHADSTGSDSYNLDLSRRRAEAVADFLRTQGVEAQRLEAVGRGEAQPIADNGTEEGRSKNRRVEIRLVPITA